jgi:hypothetical protein
MYKLKKDRRLSSKQDIHKEIYKDKNRIAAKVVIEPKQKMWDRTCSKINCELRFKRSRQAWAIPKTV